MANVDEPGELGPRTHFTAALAADERLPPALASARTSASSRALYAHDLFLLGGRMARSGSRGAIALARQLEHPYSRPALAYGA